MCAFVDRPPADYEQGKRLRPSQWAAHDVFDPIGLQASPNR